MRRRIYAIIICLCTITAISYAQQNNGQRNQRQFFSPEAYNQGLEEFVKNEAGLNDEECKKFFPLMHEMMNKQREVNSQIQQVMAKGFSAKTEADYEQIITRSINLEIENRKVEQMYYKKFHSVLSWKQIHKVRIALSRYSMEALRRFVPNYPQNNQRNWQGMPNVGNRNGNNNGNGNGNNNNNRGMFPQFGQFPQFGGQPQNQNQNRK
ncbi:MAG: hypothetical protein J5720_05060 [Bacteroidaceae bacterium]|nr:hypothetical protein [Bacteroidaceae bacterium]